MKPRIATPFLILTVLITLAVLCIIAGGFTGCATSPAGLAKEQRLYQSATNAVALATGVSSATSATPWGSILAMATTAASALVGVWAQSLHKRLNALEGTSNPFKPSSAP